MNKRVSRYLASRMSIYKFLMFDNMGGRHGYTRPRVGGGVVIMMESYLVRISENSIHEIMTHKAHRKAHRVSKMHYVYSH